MSRKISMLDFRLNTEHIIMQVQKGQRMILTRRGKPVARLEPIDDQEPDTDDPFYSITDLAVEGASLSNKQIDEILYGQ